MPDLQDLLSRKTVRASAAIASLLSLALVAQAGVTTNASWLDDEWVHQAVGTSDCASPDVNIATRGEGKALGGSLLGIDLDTLAEARGVLVTSNGERSIEATGTANDLGGGAYANPLDVVALSAVEVNLGQGLLQLPLNNETGVLGQFAQAVSAGESRGASGYVTNSGGIATAPGDEYPDLATLKLSALVASLNPTVAAVLGELTDVSLVVGAAAGRATLDGCDALWNGVIPRDELSQTGNLSRDYLLSHLYTDVASPVVGALSTEVSRVTGILESTANGLVGNTGVLSGVVDGVVNLVRPALALVSLLGIRVAPTGSLVQTTALTLDLSGVQALLDHPFSDADGVVSVTASDGTVRVNTAALLAAAYPGEYSSGLNGLPPNIQPLLGDEQVLSELTNRIGALLTSLLLQVDQKLTEALDAMELTVEVSIPIETCATALCLSGNWASAGALGITVSGTLDQLLGNGGTLTVDTSVLETVLGGLVGGILGSVLSTLTTNLTGSVRSLIGAAVDGVLRPLAKLPATTMTAVGTPIVNLVTTVYRELYLNGVVSLTINAQNDPFAGNSEPFDWGALPNGQYDVASLRVGVLDVLGLNDVRLYLARGSVGAVCSPAQLAGGGCPGY